MRLQRRAAMNVEQDASDHENANFKLRKSVGKPAIVELVLRGIAIVSLLHIYHAL